MNGTDKNKEENLLEKIRALPPEKLAEVEDFIDFLHARGDDRRLVHAATKLSEEAFKKIWDNEDDAVYDKF